MNGAAAWADAMAALALFAADPVGLGGIALRAGAGPVRDRWLALLRDAMPTDAPLRRVPPHIGDDRLLGGLDLAATLRAGRPIAQQGLLAEADGGVVLLAMAERTEPATAARLCAAMDQGAVSVLRDGLALRLPARFGLVALDEGGDPDEQPLPALLDRLAFHVDLTTVSLGDADLALLAPPRDDPRMRDRATPTRHRPRPSSAGDPPPQPDIIEAICATAAALGIVSLRAPVLAVHAARAAAAHDGRQLLTQEDLILAVRLVLAPRATVVPHHEATEAPVDEQPSSPSDSSDTDDDRPVADRPLADVVLDAVRAALPADLLSGLAPAAGTRRQTRSAGRAGLAQISVKRGRPIGARPGMPVAGARLHVLETLKAAAPWQTLRGPADVTANQPRISVRPDDFRIVRFRQRSGSTTVFAVDASGSTALNRLGEAKGAVELLLADCYVRRDQVALIAFRGTGASVLLPPTGSLLRARRCLAGLAGGGGTPLAAGIDAAAALADAIRRTGRTPVVTFLTDGRPNVARDGSAGRQRAETEALASARLLRASGTRVLLVDTAPRPHPFARRLADEMAARHVPLPYADAASLSRAVRDEVTP